MGLHVKPVEKSLLELCLIPSDQLNSHQLASTHEWITPRTNFVLPEQSEKYKNKPEKQYVPNDEFKGRLNIYINLA